MEIGIVGVIMFMGIPQLKLSLDSMVHGGLTVIGWTCGLDDANP